MYIRVSLLLALLCGLFPSLLPAQRLDIAFFHIDTIGRKPDCALPMIYFEEERAQLEESYTEDVGFLAYMMHRYPEMTLRLRTDGIYRRFDNRQRRLNRRRINRVVRSLRKDYGIRQKRIIKIYHQPWVFRSARSPEPPPLIYRRVVCDCVWN